MEILNQLETHPIPIDEEEKRRSRRFLIGLICAVILTGLLLGGFIFVRKRHERQVAAAAEAEVQKKATKVQVFVDEPMVNGKTTVLGGTIHNISTEPQQNIAVELQLRRRATSGVDLKTIPAESTYLAPDAKTRYSLEVQTQDYITATFLRVVGGADRAHVPFKILPGAPRPPMDEPASKTVVVDKARTGRRDDDFINTPNNPGRVP